MAGRVVRFLGCGSAAVAAMLCGLRGPDRALASVPDDLELDRVSEVVVRTEPTPNPHASLPCERCHTKSEASYETARKFGIRMPLTTEGGSSLELCEQCHTGNHGFHPVNFPVRRLLEAVNRAGVFPLEMPFEGYFKITCTSCHAVHFPHTAYGLLRGFPVDPLVGGAPFRTRRDFCASCHGEDEVLAFSGHRTSSGDQGCAACHGARDIAGSIGALKPGLNGACSVCHPLPSGAPPHFVEYNPFPGMGPEVLAGYGVWLLQGQFTCATCHQHHRGGPEAPFLKSGFVAAVAKSIRVNPHQTTRFCLNCHPVNPPPPGTPGALAPLIEDDVTRLCRGCHARDGALRMDHPLATPAGPGLVPADWPLGKGGALGCQTCHLAGHGPRDPENPRFLRGGPYRQRNDVCFRCHREAVYRDRDIHVEVAAGRGCEFCHVITDRTTLLPEGKAGPLLAEPVFLCLPCHAVPPHPASATHTLRPRPTSFLMIDTRKVPMTLGKITCHSCHDSHGTAPGTQFLRATAGPICTNCHPF